MRMHIHKYYGLILVDEQGRFQLITEMVAPNLPMDLKHRIAEDYLISKMIYNLTT